MCYHDELQELINSASDYKLCSGAFLLIYRILWQDNPELSVPEPARTVLLIWQSAGVIGNGGFSYLFEGSYNSDSDYSVVAIDSYRRIGMTEACAAFADALRQFPCGLPPTEVEERNAALAALPDDAFDEMNIRYYGATEEGKLEASLAQFIRENKEELARVLEAGRTNS
jgi:hypothetical protein